MKYLPYKRIFLNYGPIQIQNIDGIEHSYLKVFAPIGLNTTDANYTTIMEQYDDTILTNIQAVRNV